MNAAQLKASILQQAIEGRLVPQLPEEGVVEQIGDAPTEVPFEIPASWKWVTIKNIVVPTKQKVPDKDFTYIDVSCISSFRVAQPKFISVDKAPSRARKIVHPGMLLYATVRPYLKNICIAPEIQGDVIASTAFATFECNAIVFNRYLFYVLISDYMSSYAKSVQKGISYPAINDTDFYKTLIPLPPFEEQKRIVAKIEELMPLVEEYGKAYDKLQELNDELPGKLKASLLQEAIQGKLVPQLPEDGVVNQIGEALAELPFEIPHTWTSCTLSDVADLITDGSHNPPPNTGSGIPVLSAKDLSNGFLTADKASRWTDEEHWTSEFKRCPVQKDDIVLCIVGATIGKVGRVKVETKAMLQRSLALIRVKESIITKDFFELFLNSLFCQKWLVKGSAGTAQKGFYLKSLRNLPVVIPPLAEQKRIVAKIETLLEQVDLMTK